MVDVSTWSPWIWVGISIGILVVLIAALSLICRPRYFPLAGKVVVITGGSSGIGKAAAKAALNAGAHVALLARRPGTLNEAAAELESAKISPSQRISVHEADVTNPTSVDDAITRGVKAKHGPVIDVLINSAGISMPRRFEETSTEEFLDVYKLNVLGTRNATLSALPMMTNSQDGGRIVFVSSQAGLAGVYGYTAYSSSKFALNGFAQALQHEVYTRNIRVSVCFPPDTDTPLLTSENLIKPKVTRLLSEATATVSADVVGDALIAGIVRWSPFIPVGFDGWMLSTLTAGMGPAGSFWDAFLQVTTMGLWRLVGLLYVQHFFGVIAKNDAVSGAGGGSQSAASSSSSASLTGAGKKGSAPLLGEESKKK